MLAVATENPWPVVVIIGIVMVSIVSALNGSWPWEGIITHNHYDCDCKDKDEEND